jgi:hypothetical protein
VEFEGISTQINIGAGTPDMGMQADDLRVVVEVKVSDWRGLTDNQPQIYLEWLANEKVSNKFFVFLAPPNYSSEYLEEYNKRKETFCIANPDHGIEFIEINWLHLSSALDESGLPATCLYSRDFNRLLHEWYVSTPIKFSLDELQETDMFNTTAATALSKVFTFVESVASEIERAGLSLKVVPEFQKRWWDDGEYGIYIKCEDNNVLFLGVWTQLWKDRGCPLCIGVHNGKWSPAVIDRFKNSFPDHFTYHPSDTFPYLTKCIDQHLLMGDAARDVTNWLLVGYLNGICDILANDPRRGPV